MGGATRHADLCVGADSLNWVRFCRQGNRHHFVRGQCNKRQQIEMNNAWFRRLLTLSTSELWTRRAAPLTRHWGKRGTSWHGKLFKWNSLCWSRWKIRSINHFKRERVRETRLSTQSHDDCHRVAFLTGWRSITKNWALLAEVYFFGINTSSHNELWVLLLEYKKTL